MPLPSTDSHQCIVLERREGRCAALIIQLEPTWPVPRFLSPSAVLHFARTSRGAPYTRAQSTTIRLACLVPAAMTCSLGSKVAGWRLRGAFFLGDLG